MDPWVVTMEEKLQHTRFFEWVTTGLPCLMIPMHMHINENFARCQPREKQIFPYHCNMLQSSIHSNSGALT